MSTPSVKDFEQVGTSTDLSLTEQIAAFTTSAEKRLPPGFIDAFRALIAQLEAEGIGRLAPGVGAAFPDFVLQDDAGNRVRASEHWNDRTLVIKFYRGGWCPYCSLELAALQKQVANLAAIGAAVFAVAPEQAAAQVETKAKAGATFKFLWDRDNELAHQLGIAFPVDATVKDIYGQLGLDLMKVNGNWELPVPATFVVRGGRVKHRTIDANYLRRQDPVELVAWLRADAETDGRMLDLSESQHQKGG